MPTPILPDYVTKYFWGDNLTELNWQDHQKYITQTILEKGDAPASVWLLSKYAKPDLLALIPQLKLTPKSKNFWTLYLS